MWTPVSGTTRHLTAVRRAATLHADQPVNLGESVTRRLLLTIASIAATLSLVVAACSSAPAAPALTDPKDILTQSILSLKDVKTMEIVGALTGKVEAAQLGGSLDLSSTTIAGAIDIPNQKAKLSVDAPTLVGTKAEVILVDAFVYMKVDGLLAAQAGLPNGKYVKVAVPEQSGAPVTDQAEIDKQVDEFKTALDKLPTPPTKEADEKCGDQDCYHVRIAVSAADMKELSPEASSIDGDFTFDIWSRKSDLRPAKLSFSVTSSEFGTVGMTLDFKYDVPVDVSAPPADQVVEQ
jgi:hypothetical protein